MQNERGQILLSRAVFFGAWLLAFHRPLADVRREATTHSTVHNANFESFVESDSSPAWDFRTDRYIPSSLSASQMKQILQIPVLKYNGDNLQKLLRTAIQFVGSVSLAARDSLRWKSLAQKRYSYLRDLLTAIEIASNHQWKARDFQLRDGSFVFTGKIGELLIIRSSDAALIRIHRSKILDSRTWELLTDLSQFPSCQHSLAKA